MVGCENESDNLPVNSEMNEQEIKAINQQGKNSISAIIKSGVDIDSYFNSLPKTKNILPEIQASRDYYCSSSNYPQFFYDAEDFDCDNLLTQDFEDADDEYEWIESPLDENTDNDVFSPGDILPGISFNSSNGFYIDERHNWTKVLMPDFFYNDLTINFTTNDVYDVSMMLYSYRSLIAYVQLYDIDNNYIDGSNIYINDYDGGYLGIKSNEPIGRIQLYGNYFFNTVGIGSISFGLCSDSDGDGCLSEDDAYPHSNMDETLSIGCADSDITNNFVDCGTTMMDQIDNLIAEINSEYDGDNWNYLHRKFTRKMTRLTYYWRRDGLITRAERRSISSDAEQSNIPYFEDYDNV